MNEVNEKKHFNFGIKDTLDNIDMETVAKLHSENPEEEATLIDTLLEAEEVIYGGPKSNQGEDLIIKIAELFKSNEPEAIIMYFKEIEDDRYWSRFPAFTKGKVQGVLAADSLLEDKHTITPYPGSKEEAFHNGWYQGYTQVIMHRIDDFLSLDRNKEKKKIILEQVYDDFKNKANDIKTADDLCRADAKFFRGGAGSTVVDLKSDSNEIYQR